MVYRTVFCYYPSKSQSVYFYLRLCHIRRIHSKHAKVSQYVSSHLELTFLHPHPIVKSESNRNSRCFPAFCFSLLPSHHLHRVRAPPELSMTPWRSWSPMSRTLPSGESLVITNSLIQWPTILL